MTPLVFQLLQICIACPIVSGDSPITLEQLQDQVKLIAPIVEKHAERQFKELPPIRTVDAKEMEELLVADIDHVCKLLKVVLDDLEGALAMLDLASAAAPTLVGKYVLHKKEIVISSTAIEAVAAKHGWTPQQEAALVKLVLAHELVHALSDQVVGYDRAIANLADSKLKRRIFGPLNEGVACVLTHKMAADLGIAAEFDQLEKVYLDSPHLGKEYRFGQSIMQKVLDRFGINGLWSNLENPIDVDLSGNQSDDGNRFKKLLQSEGVSRVIAGCGPAEYMEAPPEMSMQFFRHLDPQLVGELKNGLERGYTAGCVKRDNPDRVQIASVIIYAGRTEEGARAVFEAHAAATDSILKKLQTAMPMESSPIQSAAMAPGSMYRYRRITSKNKQTPMENYFAWYQVNRYVIQIMTINATSGDSDVTAAFDSIEKGLRDSP